jgi:hypothetical protein
MRCVALIKRLTMGTTRELYSSETYQLQELSVAANGSLNR